MALKTKPEQITAEDHKLVRQFIKDSKAAGFDPTLTTIILNKTRSDKSGKAAKLVANTQRKVNKKRPAVDPARAARSAEARRQAKRAGREAKAIKDEGGFLTNEEWLKMIAQMGVTVAGGGVALIRAATDANFEVDNEDQAIGVQIVRKAVFGPLRQMAANAGESPDIIETIVAGMEGSEGWDFRNAVTCDLIENGIIDPVKVTRCALQNAVSAAGTLITTNYAIIQS